MGAIVKVAIVTPYWRETPAVLQRCIDSVAGQADHFLIADGVPQPWIDEHPVRHIRLDRSHGDYGGVARSIGAMLAIGEGYDAIGFLDADNWLYPDHVEHCLEVASMVHECDYVIAHMTSRRPDGSAIEFEEQSYEQHVDTNAFFFLRGAFHLLPVWGTMPKIATPVGDRFFYAAVREQGLRRAVAGRKTVNYLCIAEPVYRSIGETPPPGAKPYISPAGIVEWRKSMSARDRIIASRLMSLKDMLA